MGLLREFALTNCRSLSSVGRERGSNSRSKDYPTEETRFSKRYRKSIPRGFHSRVRSGRAALAAALPDRQCGCSLSGREEQELHAFLIWTRDGAEAVSPFTVWCSPPGSVAARLGVAGSERFCLRQRHLSRHPWAASFPTSVKSVLAPSFASEGRVGSTFQLVGRPSSAGT
jgi:hypothetical protein